MDLTPKAISLTARSITFGFRKHPVLHDVSAAVEPGVMLGILGPNGCGKTTLLRVLRGTLAPQSGRVCLGERSLAAIANLELARMIAFVPQEITLELAFTVRELVMMGRSPHIDRMGGESPADHAIAEDAMRQVDVLSLADRAVTTLSGGERRRAVLAMCLAQQPRILLLDEPTNHLDLGHQLEILDRLDRLRRESRLAIAAVFHDWNLAAEYCQKLLVIDKGRVVAEGTPTDVVTEALLKKLYGIEAIVQANPRTGRPCVLLVGRGQ
jgi:iron complex transport system ATP-binding protein